MQHEIAISRVYKKGQHDCTCAQHQQLHCVRFRMGECDGKPIPDTFSDPKVRYGHIGRPEPVAKKQPGRPRAQRDRSS